MKEIFILFVFGFSFKITCAQSNLITSKAYTGINKAKMLSYEEKYSEAFKLLEEVKNELINSKKTELVRGFSNYCSAVVAESEIYEDLENYDKAVEVIKPLRQEIFNKYDLNRHDILDIYYSVAMQEVSVYFEAEKYKEGLSVIEPLRLKLIANYDLSDVNLFSKYMGVADIEGILLSLNGDLRQVFNFKNNEANRIKPFMNGNNLMAIFYFENKRTALREITPFVTPSKEQLTIAAKGVQELLIEIKETKFQDNETKTEFIEYLIDDYFNYKEFFCNPYIQGDYNPSFETLELAISNLKSLLDELNLNTLISKEKKKERQEDIKKQIIDLTDTNKSKEKQEGKYQDYLTYHNKKKQFKVVKKDFDYFVDKLEDINELLTTEMYFQQIRLLDELILELNSSDLKQKDLTNYNLLNHTIFMSYFSAFSALKDLDNAVISLNKSISFYKKQPKEYTNETTLKSFDINYASLYFLNKQYEKALEYAFKYLELPIDSAGHMYSFIGSIYYEMKQYNKAIEWHEKHLTFLEGKKTEEIGEHAVPLAKYNLGKSYLGANNVDKAKEFITISLDYFKKESTPNYLKYYVPHAYADLGIIYQKKGMIKKSNLYMNKFSESLKRPYFESLLNSTESNRASNLSQNPYGPNDLFYYISQQNVLEGKLVSEGYNYALLSKQLLLSTSETIRNNASIDDIPQLKEINNKWKRVTEKLRDVDIENSDSLTDYARVYEKELIARGKGSILQLFEKSKIEWTDVKENLKIGEAAIEFVSFIPHKFNDDSNNVYYGAFILKKDAEHPVFINLFKEIALKGIVNPIFNQKLTANEEVTQIYKSNGEAIYDLIWSPLEDVLKGVVKIYFSPTGILHNFSFTALPTEKEHQTLGEKYRLIQLGSTKNIMDTKPVYKYNKALLFGDIAYNYDISKRELLKEESSLRNSRGGDFKLLPGTKTEINELEKVLKENNISASIYTQNTASEENLLLSVNKNPDILHISTHAFYLKPIEEEFFMTDMIGFAKLKGDNNPMNRSGIALAEANYFWKYGDKISVDKEDGVLTANEISTLRLSGVNLAVLSACETALGDSSNNEGVFGLQRGLKMAGVNNLLLSLWKVDDKVTQEYMVDFYSNLIDKKLSISEAYFKTQNTIKSKYPNPYYWAAFVLIR